MHERVRRLNGHVRHADEVKHRQMLGIRAADRSDRAKLADAVGRADRADPIDSSVAVRRRTPRSTHYNIRPNEFPGAGKSRR
jgi:hypothetical protein